MTLKFLRFAEAGDKADPTDYLEKFGEEKFLEKLSKPKDDVKFETLEPDMTFEFDKINGLERRHIDQWTGDAYYGKGDYSLAFFCIATLIRMKANKEQCLRAMTNPDWACSAYALEKGQAGALLRAEKIYKKALEAIDKDYVRNGKGAIDANHPDNIRKGLKALGIKIWHDAFARVDHVEGLSPSLDGAMFDDAYSEIWLRLIAQEGFKVPENVFYRAIHSIAMEDSRNRVTDMLDRCQAMYEAIPEDERPKIIGNWLVRYGGAEDSLDQCRRLFLPP